jgi:tetrahydrodipicolinate N-succinyltransferase
LIQKLYSELVRQSIKDAGLQNVTFFDDWFMGNIFHSGFEIRSKGKADLLKTYEQLGALSEQVKNRNSTGVIQTIKQKVIKTTFTPLPTHAKDIAAYYEDIIGRHKYVLPSESRFSVQKILDELKEEEIRSYPSLLPKSQISF